MKKLETKEIYRKIEFSFLGILSSQSFWHIVEKSYIVKLDIFDTAFMFMFAICIAASIYFVLFKKE